MENDEVYKLQKLMLDGLFAKSSLEQILSDIAKQLQLLIQIIGLNSSVLLDFQENTSSRYSAVFSHIPDTELAGFFRSGKATDKYTGEGEVLCPINISGVPFGIVRVTAGGKADSKLIRIAALRIAQLSQKFFHTDIYLSPFNLLHNSFLTHFLFLQKSDDNRELGEGHSLLEDIRLRAPFLMMAFCSTSFGEPLVYEADGNIERFLPKAVHLVNNGCLYAFLSDVSEKALEQDSSFLTNIEEFCRSYRLRGAISEIFDDLKVRGLYKNQARELLDSNTETKPLILANDLYSHLIFLDAKERFGASFFLLSNVYALAAYDEEHNTEYLGSLKVYLDIGNRVSIAAKQLFFDHSTMIYRLKKIKKIVDCDIDDPETAIALRFSLMTYYMNMQ